MIPVVVTQPSATPHAAAVTPHAAATTPYVAAAEPYVTDVSLPASFFRAATGAQLASTS